MKKKLIIITTLIIRGNYHKKSLGKFYENFIEFLKDYDVYHIINIDEPVYLKKYFNKYETIDLLNRIIPEQINRIYIDKENPGFLNAYKKSMDKIEELNLNSENNLFWWFEDDWAFVNKDINIFKLGTIFSELKNSALMFTKSSPLGSFRAGPLMSGSYFLNFFNIHKMKIPNNTCDPERQVRRWLSGKKYNIGRKEIHRMINENNNTIDIIQLVNNKKNININNFMKWCYPGKYFNNELKFNFHIIQIDENFKTFYYSKLNQNNKFNINEINKNDLFKIFDNNNIKYINFYPYIFIDIGRIFNEKYSLIKWTTINDGTTYNVNSFKILQLGNKNNLNIDEIRLNYKLTYNESFYSGIVNILYNIEKFNNEYKKINIKYFSHLYGSYPNFNVISKLIKLNLKPEVLNQNKFINYELINIDKNIIDKINFKLYHNYFNEIFKFNEKIINEKNDFFSKFKNKKIIGFYFEKNNNNKNLIEKFKNIDNYDHILINKEIDIKDKNLKNKIININSKTYNFKKRFHDIKNIICKINDCSSEKRVVLEMKLKELTLKNEESLYSKILNLLILSQCEKIVSDQINFLILCKIIKLNILIETIF